MYYILNENLALRGWKKLPYALHKLGSGDVVFLQEDVFCMLSYCNGLIDLDSPLMPDGTQAHLKEAIARGLVARCEYGHPLNPAQEYKKYDCRYIDRAHWSITGKCNYRCKHCYMSAPDAKYGELTTAQCLYIIEQLAQCGVYNVSITGGEPLIRRDFFELLDAMLDKGMHITTIYTNGKLVNRALLEALAKRGVCPEFNMSFDGVGWHDWLRGIKGAETAVLDAFRLCRAHGFPTGAEMCLHRGNLHTLRDSVNLLASVGCTHVKTNPVSDTELWAKYAGDYSIGIKTLYDAYLDYIPRYYDDGKPMNIMLGGFFYAERGKANYEIPSARFGGDKCSARQCICGHARNNMYIAADGRLLPCLPFAACQAQIQRFPFIFDQGLAKGLTDSEYMRVIDTRLEEFLARNPACATCEHAYVCGGGCRSAGLLERGDFFAPDPYTCAIFKDGYFEKINQVAQDAIERFEQQSADRTDTTQSAAE